MKKLILFGTFLLIACQLFAQVVTTVPSIVVQQTGTSITVTFDDSFITSLNGNAGPLYVHTGVITTLSTSNADWKNVITPWPSSTNLALANTTANKLTQVGTSTKWTLSMTDINTYYGLTAGTIVTQLAFVVRTADGSLQSSNLYVPVYQPGLNVKVTSPTTNSLIAQGTTSTISAVASNGSQSCNINLYIGSTSTPNITSTTPIKSGTAVNTLSTTYAFNTADNFYVITQGTSNGLTKYDTAYVCVAKPQVSLARPTGLKEGVTINTDGSVTFCLSLVRGAPVSTTSVVFLLGDFNNFRIDNKYMMNLQLENTTYGYNTNFYWLTLTGLDPSKEYAFQYYVDGLTATSPMRVGDPYCEKILDPNNDQYINQSNNIYPNLRSYPSGQTTGVVSCFQINPVKYQWQTTNFTPPAQNKLMIYEMLFRDFTTQGSVQAAIQKLDYIKSLGVNAVELMPIMEFDGNDSWGYNPNFYFAPDKAYGTKLDYQQFIDECHKRGLAVILDVVFNHTWGLSPYCMLYWDATNNRPLMTNPYYNAVAPHPYSVGNDLNHSRSFVRAWLKRALQFWVTEYKVDGYRFDLSKGFTQTQSTEATVSNYDASRISYIEEYVDAIKASNANDYAILEHFCNTDEEDALAAYKGTILWRKMVDPYDQAAMGYSTSSDFNGIIGTNRVGYPESHDEERMAYKALAFGQPAVKDTTTCMHQLAAVGAFAYLNPGPRMMWQFGELGYNTTIDFNGRTGRKPIHWDYLNVPSRKALYDTYSKFLTFRNLYGDLFSSPTSWNWQVSVNDWTSGRRIFLQNSNLTAIILGNFTGTNSVTATPGFTKTGIWYNLIDGSQLNVSNTSMTVTLQIGDLAIYTDKQVNFASGINDISTNTTTKVFPTETFDFVYISTPSIVKSILIYNQQGSLVKSVYNSTEINMKELPKGLYLFNVSTLDGSSVHKIIKE